MNASRQRLVIIVLVLMLVLAWLVLDRVGVANPLRDALSRVLTPIELVARRVGQPLFRGVEALRGLSRLREENAALREENAALKNALILAQEAAIENETLRRELNFKSAVPSYQLLSAEVIGRDPNNLLRYLLIDRGAQDSIARGMPVLTAQGLVGRISEVSANSAKVMLLTDPSSSVAALVQRTRSTGVVQGQLGDQLLMRYIPPDDPILAGDIVLTSGLGGNFPKRLVLGEVTLIEHEDVEMFQVARIRPVVDLSNLEVVQVLLSFAPAELAQPEEAITQPESLPIASPTASPSSTPTGRQP